MFSGHAAYYVLMTMFFIYFGKNKIENIIILIYAIIGTITVIAGRLHYTVDIFVATFITILSFYTFRYFCITHKYLKFLRMCELHKA